MILVNVDGFSRPPVFRSPPPLRNLTLTAPFDFNGRTPDLKTFITRAVVQHFPKTLQRIPRGQQPTGTMPDFRLPQADELEALEAFLRSLQVPHDANFELDRLLRTAAQRRGRELFFGDTAKCAQCHDGMALSDAKTTLPGGGGNRAFDTGVAQHQTDPRLRDRELRRLFSTPQLFDVRHTAPFFHDNSATNLRDAVEFCASDAFKNSPAATEVGTITLASNEIDDLVAFMEALTCPHNGDVNQDGKVTPEDALLAFRYSLGLEQLDTCQQDHADVRASGHGVTPGDALCIFQKFLGIPSCLDDRVPAKLLVETCSSTSPCTGRVGTALPLRVRVTNAGGVGLQGIDVVFQLNNTTTLGTVKTAADGRAARSFTPTAREIGIPLVTAMAGDLTTRLQLTVTDPGNSDI
ncbi:MAG: hypothetical protein FJZ47_24080, partial [Candidatus Tectomicrobia bacterium]|nr:hypothetical protein [Candidatus Tectomicrobia bacterium]